MFLDSMDIIIPRSKNILALIKFKYLLDKQATMKSLISELERKN